MQCYDSPDKIQFGTLRGAVEQTTWTYESYGVWQRPYRCDSCHEYHLTSHDLDGQPVTAEQAGQLIEAVCR